jgi:hypothetical protein
VRGLVVALVLALGLSACTMSNELGECKGLATEDEMRRDLRYEVKTSNVIWAVIFSETLLWPGLTAAFWLKCPVERIQPPQQ